MDKKEQILDIAEKLYHNHLTPEKATNLLLNLHNVNLSLPTHEHIKSAAGKKALKYAFENDYEYEKYIKAIIEGANFVIEKYNNTYKK